MKILLLGKNGQLGWELQRALAPLGEVHAFSRTDEDTAIDLSDPDQLKIAIESIRPDLIFNAAAYTAVDLAESDPEGARRINTDAPTVIADEAKRIDALFVHYSTDYVFDGGGDLPWTEVCEPAPQSIYGQTKLDGETAIQASGCKYLIFRTSWVYARRGKNFLKTILTLAESREELKIVSDQIGAPTGAEFLADASAVASLMAWRQSNLCGLYHLAAGGEASWHGYAKYLIEKARTLGKPLALKSLLEVPSSSYLQKARRPLNSRLSMEKFRQNFGLTVPDWKLGVERVVTELVERSQ
jgi:dTDP-4-dehydrorhamnose reductase